MIALIGASGFAGHRVARALRKAHPEEAIVAVLRESSSRERLAGLGIEYRTADLGQRIEIQSAVKGARWIVCAASLGFGHAGKICESIAAAEPEHAVFFSTTAIFTHIDSQSLGTRLAAEDLIRTSHFPATILRPTMIYGRPGDRNIERLLRALRRLPVMATVGRGRGLQQPVHVDDVAGAVVNVLHMPAEAVGREFNLPGPTPLSFSSLVRRAATAVGCSPLLVPIPSTAARLAASALSKARVGPRISSEQIARILEDKAFSWVQANAAFGYHPRSFEIGVREEARLLGLAPARSGATSAEG